jgi:hypothetical protein
MGNLIACVQVFPSFVMAVDNIGDLHEEAVVRMVAEQYINTSRLLEHEPGAQAEESDYLLVRIERGIHHHLDVRRDRERYL